MTNSEIWPLVEAEMKRAKKKHPRWPVHLSAKVAIVSEEMGELVRACNQYKIEHKRDVEGKQAVINEAVQLIVTGFRFLENLK